MIRASHFSVAVVVGAALVAAGCTKEQSPEATRARTASGNGPDVAAAANTEPAPSSVETPAAASPVAEPAAAPVSAPVSPPRARIEKPVITFQERVHDFGEVWDFEKHACRFPFENTGDGELVIERVKPDCGCTTTTLERTRFGASEGSAIEVKFEPKGKGRQRKRINVFSNATEQVVVLEIRAEVRRFMALDVAYLRFGEVRIGDSPTEYVTVTGVDPELVIESVEVNSPHLRAELLPSDTGPQPPGTFTIGVTLTGTAPWGQLYGSVKITGRGMTPDGQYVTHTTPVTVAARVHGELKATDTMFRVAKIRPGATFEKSIRLTRVSREPFEIDATLLNPSVPGTELEVKKLEIPGTSGYDLIVRGDTTGYTGLITGIVRVQTDFPGEENLTFRIAGNATNE